MAEPIRREELSTCGWRMRSVTSFTCPNGDGIAKLSVTAETSRRVDAASPSIALPIACSR
jgi:hypothetical protein